MQQSKKSGRNSRIWDMNEIDDKIIARLTIKSGQPLLVNPVGFADEVVDMVKIPRREAIRYPLYFRFAWAAVLSAITVLIGIWWNGTGGDNDSGVDGCTFIENKKALSKQTISNISATINLVEQYKSLK